MPRHAVGPEAAARRSRQHLRRAIGRVAALLRERADARTLRADAALPGLCPELLPPAAGWHTDGAAGVSGRRTRSATYRSARAVEQRPAWAVSRLDLAAPAARRHRLSGTGRSPAAACAWRRWAARRLALAR